MREATPELALPFLQIFYENDRGEELDMLCASFVYSHMIFPRHGEAQHRLRYQALAFQAALEALETKSGNLKQYLEIMQVVIEDTFKTHAEYTKILTTARFPANGDGSLQSRAWQGMLAGEMFYEIIKNNSTLLQAAKDVAKQLLTHPPEERQGLARSL